ESAAPRRRHAQVDGGAESARDDVSHKSQVASPQVPASRHTVVMALDPVCGMTVDPARAAGQVEHEGTTYYFCSKGCAAKFTADPKRYLSGSRDPMQPAQVPLVTIGGLKRLHVAGGAPLHAAGETTQHVAGSAQHLAGE